MVAPTSSPGHKTIKLRRKYPIAVRVRNDLADTVAGTEAEELAAGHGYGLGKTGRTPASLPLAGTPRTKRQFPSTLPIYRSEEFAASVAVLFLQKFTVRHRTHVIARDREFSFVCFMLVPLPAKARMQFDHTKASPCRTATARRTWRRQS